MEKRSSSRIILMNVPRPKDEEFCARVKAEIESANKRVDVLEAEFKNANPDLPLFSYIPTISAPDLPLAYAVIQRPETLRYLSNRRASYQAGTCLSCGVPWDEFTENCDNCKSRHKQRDQAKAAKGRIEIAKEVSYSSQVENQVEATAEVCVGSLGEEGNRSERRSQVAVEER